MDSLLVLVNVGEAKRFLQDGTIGIRFLHVIGFNSLSFKDNDCNILKIITLNVS